MSVVVIGRLEVDPAKFYAVTESRKDVFEKVAAIAKSAGAIHHQFLVGDGEVVILDEWDTAASFRKFFAENTDIPGLMQEAGVQGPPDIMIYETTPSPDKF